MNDDGERDPRGDERHHPRVLEPRQLAWKDARELGRFLRRPISISFLLVTASWLTVAGIGWHSGLQPFVLFLVIPWLASLLLVSIWHAIWRWLNPKGSQHIGGVLLRCSPALLLFAPATLLLCDHLYQIQPQVLFRKLVVDPIPASVTSIESCGRHALLFDATAIYFEVSPEDFEKVLQEHVYVRSSIERYVQEMVIDELDLPVEQLAPYSVVEATLISDDTERFHQKIIIASEDKTRVWFLNVYGS